MDFFESQERAKRNTAWLVALFAVGVAATVVSVHVLVAATVGRGRFLDPSVFVGCAGSVLAVVGVGTLVKFAQMSHGGRAVAEALGGRQIDPGSADPDERRVLNVVEEMAIASGVRVPPVYIMEDATINAFAAGNSEKDAVIGVTRGCIHELSRDELQGVMAHEFSHVFHRDMRLNMRLVGWLGGIFAVSMIGRIMLNSMRFSRPSRGKNDGRALVLALGVGLFIIGIVGYFFGRIIQAAVSRQREFLADASAVQYTRNPDGIAGALEKIARGAGSRLEAPAAAEFSHFLFASGIASLFSTHPPLEERIKRIRGARMVAAGVTAAGAARVGGGAGAAGGARIAASSAFSPPVVARGADASSGDSVSAAAVRESRASMGSVSPRELSGAREILGSMPASVLEAARSPFAARAVVCLLLLSSDDRERARQIAVIASNDEALAQETAQLARTARIGARDRLPVLEACAAALSLLSPAQYAQFRTTLAQLIAADGQVDRVEWTVRVVLRHAVESRGAALDPRGRATADDLALVTSVLAWSGASDADGALRAWRAARGAEPSLPAEPVPAKRCTLDALDGSLRAFAGSGPAMKRRLVDACVACVAADGQTTVEEAELLRAVCASIGAPMPPVLPVASQG